MISALNIAISFLCLGFTIGAFSSALASRRWGSAPREVILLFAGASSFLAFVAAASLVWP